MRNDTRLAPFLFAAMFLFSAVSVRAQAPVPSTGLNAKAKQIAEAETTPAAEMDTWHAATFVSGRIGLRVIQYWSKGSWMRAETLVRGHPIVTIVRGNNYFSFDRLTGVGVKIQRSPEAVKGDAGRLRPFGNDWQELVAQGAVKVEDSTRAGQAVEIWRITDGLGRRKLWLTHQEPKLPMRIEHFVRAGAETITTDYSDWVKGLEIPDAFFDVPSEIRLETFDYAGYVEDSTTRHGAPVLYPEMLHGSNLD